MILSKRIIPVFIFFLVISAQILAQNSELTKPLTIGDKVPDLVFDSIINYKSSSAKLSDFKGRLIILDFWSRDCGSCISELPHKEELQKKFGNKIAIIPVNDEKNGKEVIPKFWAANNITRSLSLPTVIDEHRALLRYFPRPGAGLQVWIDSSRTIRGITTPEYVNEKEIAKILNGNYPSWPHWKRVKYNYEKSLINIMGKDLNLPQLNCFAIFNHADDISEFFQFVIDSTKQLKRYTAINRPILSFYNSCYAKIGKVFPFQNRVLVLTKDSTRFFKGEMYQEGWWINNSYCCEKVSAIDKKDSSFFEEFRIELDNQFGIKSYIKKVKQKCLVISQSKKGRNISNTSLETKSVYSSTLEEFVKDMNLNNFSKEPLIISPKASHINEHIIFVPVVNWGNQTQLLQLIREHGYKIELIEMNIPMIIIEDIRR